MGRVRGLKGQLLNGTETDCDYIAYSIFNQKNKILAHILVWETFNNREKPSNMDINHINGNKFDNRLSNLELVTHQKNMQKAACETNVWNFRKVMELDEEENILRIFNNATEAANAIGILPSSMRNSIRRNGRCSNGLKYQYIENDEL